MVLEAHEAAKQISVQVQHGFAGLEIPAPDLTGFNAVAQAVHETLAEIYAEVQDPIEIPPLEVPGLGETKRKVKSTFQDIRETAEAAFFIRDGFNAAFGAIGEDLAQLSAPFLAYEQSLANVNTLLGVGDDAAALYGEGLQAMVGEARQPLGDLTEGLYDAVSAFGQTGDILDIVRINAQAGAAGLTSTADAIALTSAVTKGYGDTSAAAVEHAADLAFQAVRLGQTTFPELAAALPRVTAMSNQLNVAQEELFATFATATGVTGSASEVATQYNAVLAALMDPTADLTKLIEAQGYTSAESMVQAVGLADTIAAIVEEAEASGQPLADYIGSIEGQRLALSLAGQQADDYAAKTEAMQAASGGMATAFERNTDTLQSSIDQMQNELDVLRTSVMENVEGFVLLGTDAMGDLLGWLNDANPALRTTAYGFLFMAEAAVEVAVSGILPLVGYAPQVVKGIRAMTTATWGFVTSMRALKIATGVGVVLVLAELIFSAHEAEGAVRDAGAGMAAMGDDAETAAGKLAKLTDGLHGLTDERIDQRLAVTRGHLVETNLEIAALTRSLFELENDPAFNKTVKDGKAPGHKRLSGEAQRLQAEAQVLRNEIAVLQADSQAFAQAHEQILGEIRAREARAEQAAQRERIRLTEEEQAAAVKAHEALVEQAEKLDIEAISDGHRRHIEEINAWFLRESEAIQARAAEARRAEGANLAEIQQMEAAALDDLSAIYLRRLDERIEGRMDAERDLLADLEAENQAALDGMVEADIEAREQAEEAITDAMARGADERADLAQREFDERLRQAEDYFQSVGNAVADAYAFQRQLSETEIELKQLEYEQERVSLQAMLDQGRISRTEYNLRMKKLQEDELKFQKQADRERESSAVRAARAAANATRQAIGDSLRGYVAEGALAAFASVLEAVPFPANVVVAPITAGAVEGVGNALIAGLGFRKGGFTGHLPADVIAGVVHGGEYVIPADVVGGQPGAFDEFVGLARRGLTLDDMLGVMGLPGYREGGLVAASVVVPASERAARASRRVRGDASAGGLAAEMRAVRQEVAGVRQAVRDLHNTQRIQGSPKLLVEGQDAVAFEEEAAEQRTQERAMKRGGLR